MSGVQKSLFSAVPRYFAFEAAAAFSGPRTRGQRRLGVAAGQAFDADYVVAADCLGDGAKDAHAR